MWCVNFRFHCLTYIAQVQKKPPTKENGIETKQPPPQLAIAITTMPPPIINHSQRVTQQHYPYPLAAAHILFLKYTSKYSKKYFHFFLCLFCSMTLCSVGVSWEKFGAELFVVPTRQGTLTLLGRISWWASPKSPKHPWGYNLQLTPWILHPCTLCLLQPDGNFSDVDLNQIKLFGNFPQPRTPEDKIYNLHLGSFTQVQQLLKCWTVWKI